jgi:hypothetical protein
MPPWARASAAERWLVCPASTVLPVGPDTAGEAARWGTEVHDWKATGGEPVDGEFSVLIRKRLVALTGDPTGEPLRQELWPAELGTHELAVSVCAVTGRTFTFRGTAAERNEWKWSRPESHVVGTMDWLGEMADRPWVDDLKTGKIPDDPDAPQVRVYGVAGAAEFLSVTHWPRYPLARPPSREWADFPERDRAATMADIRAAYRGHLEARGSLLLAEPPRTVPGDHCRWCPSRPSCPEHQEDL